MKELDWVSERANCSLVGIFEKLKAQLQQDVAKRKELLGVPNHFNFRVETTHSSATAILIGRQIHDSVAFHLTDTAIEVRDAGGAVTYKATPTLSDDGECRLKVNGQERELWQFRKMALEDLLFRYE